MILSKRTFVLALVGGLSLLGSAGSHAQTQLASMSGALAQADGAAPTKAERSERAPLDLL